MIARSLKATYFYLMSPVMRINSFKSRMFGNKSGLKVQLGPGQGRYLEGWCNVDANIFSAKADKWCDLRYRLPFRANTVEAFYSHHVIEHLPNLHRHLSDVYSCLKQGGVYRIGCPNGDSAINRFINNDVDWFGDFPDSRKSIGGRLENFLMCRGEHLTILTKSFLFELLEDAGFETCRVYLPTRTTGFPELFEEVLEIEHERDFDFPHTLIIEAQK